MPDIGKFITYRTPKGPGVRLDDGFEEGMEIPIYYDPMISKLITYGASRKEAISRMLRAIDEYVITGVATTLPFCKFVMQHEAFVSGKFDTHFVTKYFIPEFLAEAPGEEELIAAIFAAEMINKRAGSALSDKKPSQPLKSSAWKVNRLS